MSLETKCAQEATFAATDQYLSILTLMSVLRVIIALK